MKKQTALIFYLLGAYVVLQFAWWGFHLIELTASSHKDSQFVTKRILMVVGEGFVFFTILLIGLSKIRSSIKKELQLSKRQNNFMLSVTHELKTPLSANKLYLQTLQKHGLDESKRANFIDKAIQENDRLETMINNILSAAQLENNGIVVSKSTVDLGGMFHQIIEKIHKRNQREFIQAAIEPGLFVSVDAFIIETICNNLVENALKYAGENAIIELYLKKTEQQLIFGIKDNGPGIDLETQQSMFQKFYRAGNEETRQQKGSGLGLFIVDQLVKIHASKITYRSNSPTGAIFEITL